jgi:hypothetical protein
MSNKERVIRQVTEDLYDGYICRDTDGTLFMLVFLISLLGKKGLESFAEEFGYVARESE